MSANEAIRNEESHKQNVIYLQTELNILKQKILHKKQKHQDTLMKL